MPRTRHIPLAVLDARLERLRGIVEERRGARRHARRVRSGRVPDSRGWLKQGRGHHLAWILEDDGRRLEVRAAGRLYGRWMVEEWTGEYTQGHFKQERKMTAHAYAMDLREAKRKAEAILRGEEVERGAKGWTGEWAMKGAFRR